MAIKLPESYGLGQSKVRNFPKTQYDKIVEIVRALNELTDGAITTDDLTLTDDLTVGGDSALTGTLSVTGASTLTDTSIAGLLYLADTPQTLTGAGAVNLTTKTTLLVTTGANALTLAAGTDGQIKIITMKTDGGDGTLTPTGLRGGTTITFNDVGDTVTLLYKDSAWLILSNFGATVA